MNNQTTDQTELQFQIAEHHEQIMQLFDQNGLAAIKIDTHDGMGQVVIEFESMELGGQMPTNITLKMNRIVEEMVKLTGLNLYWWFTIETPWKARIEIK